MSTKRQEKETAAQRKVREAREVIKAAEERERKKWQKKWKSPEYKAECAARAAEYNKPENVAKRAAAAAKREATKKANAAAKLAEKLKVAESVLGKRGESERTNTAYHEAGHAVVAELVLGGVYEASIIPEFNCKEGQTPSQGSVESMGHVRASHDFTKTAPEDAAIREVMMDMAGGMAAEMSSALNFAKRLKAQSMRWNKEYKKKYGREFQPIGSSFHGGVHPLTRVKDTFLEYTWKKGWQCSGDRKCADGTYRARNVSRAQRQAIEETAAGNTHALLSDKRVWAAVEAVKDALLVHKLLHGSAIRGIVKRNLFPKLKLFTGLDMTASY
jgi:hypothetical protein